MRMYRDGEAMIGKVCVCSIGRPAIVVGTKKFPWGWAWTGIGLDGKGVWCSTDPCIIAENGQEYYDRLEERNL
jgi:hypothetical protein